MVRIIKKEDVLTHPLFLLLYSKVEGLQIFIP